MSYLRPLNLDPKDLCLTATDAWLKHVFTMIRNYHILATRWSPLSCSSSTTDLYTDLGIPENAHYSGWSSSCRLVVDYMDYLLPRSMQEEVFHRGAQVLRQEQLLEVASTGGGHDLFVPFFQLFWRSDFQLLNLPGMSSSSDRTRVLENLAENLRDGPSPEVAKFRMFDNQTLTLEESYFLKRALRDLGANLRVLVLWKVCDDAMLAILGSTCRSLEAVDLWRSGNVTDAGLRYLLRLGWDPRGDSGQQGHQVRLTLRRVVIKETSCTHVGSVCLIVHCPNLEVLDFGGVVVKEFLVAIRGLYLKNRQTFSLKTLFLPVASEDVLKDMVHAFPNLEDLRIWTSVSRIRSLKDMEFPFLRSLMLGGLHSNQILKDLVVVWGRQLTTLKVETVLTVIPLEVIAKHCWNLAELQVINARLAVQDHDCELDYGMENPPFANLKLVYFFLVKYLKITQGGSLPLTALHCILRHAKSLEGIQATGTPIFTDDSLEETLMVNPLRNLRRFILTTVCHPTENNAPATHSSNLSIRSVYKLFEHCPHLQCIGDLRHWAISPEERRQMFQRIRNKQGPKLILNSCLPANPT